MNYQNAFNCKNCPERDDELGCPLWWEIIEEEEFTKRVRVTKICGLAHIPAIFKYVINSVERPAAEVEAVRNEIGKGFQALVQVTGNVISEAVKRMQRLEKSDGNP